MAYISDNGLYVTVEKGDTLSEIARDFRNYTDPKNATYQTLASWNKIPNANLIYPGQKIYLSKNTTSTSTTKTSGKMVTIIQFGLKSDSNDTLFIAWQFDQASKVEKYKARWRYRVDGKWSNWDEQDTTNQYHTYTINKDLENLSQVQAQVIPVAKSDSGLSSLQWSSTKTYYGGVLPETPSNLSVSIDGLVLTAEVTNIKTDIEQIIFQRAINNVKEGSGVKTKIETNSSKKIWDLEAGKVYKVRCAAYANGMTGHWSDWSQEFKTIPTAPAIKDCKTVALSDAEGISVKITWGAVASATSYKLQYATDKEHFDKTDLPTNVNPGEQTEWIVSGLEKGKQYYFRVSATNEVGDSSWSEVKDILVSSQPAAPTIWSSTSVVGAYDPLTLYWMHNSEDQSKESCAQLIVSVTVNNVSKEVVNEVIKRDKADDKTVSSYNFKMVDEYGRALYPNGGELQWLVRTAGLFDEKNAEETPFGDWSETRTVHIYAQPTMELSVTGYDGKDLSTDKYYIVEHVAADIWTMSNREVEVTQVFAVPDMKTAEGLQVYIGVRPDGEEEYCSLNSRSLKSFPLNVSASVTGNLENQTPISYHVSISVESEEDYETVDELGNTITIVSGTDIYSKQFDSETLNISLSAGDVRFENEVTYLLKCTVIMDSGLSATESKVFGVLWEGEEFLPTADIYVDKETISASIVPYCAKYISEYRKVEYSRGMYTMTEEKIDGVYGSRIEGAQVETGEPVYFGTTSEGTESYYCIKEDSVRITDCVLAVYRRECDGSFTELRSGIDGSTNVTVTDPHPSLDYARYRIVATSKTTGAVSYYDTPGEDVGEKSIVIQWDEPWSNFDVHGRDDTPVQLEGSGSMIKLPYNIDVSSKNDIDVSLVKYIGRKHPVSYYGTQLGESQTWNTVIDKTDKSTLYALRRLQSWTGDAYVREPSGSGYWAHVTVSFNEKHNDLIIPITFNITRVEGGV